MVNHQRSLDATFGALADPTRRAILAALMLGQSSVTELARPHRMSLPAVMKHLRVLESAGLVTQRKIGRSRRCRLEAQPLENAEAWISQYRAFWSKQFDSLDRYLAEQHLTEQSQREASEWPKNKRRPRQR
jgi:DNA-binding transcriptional ArsR family regulator